MPEIAAPTTAETIVEVLEHHVRTHGERPHLRIWHGEGDEICLTYADLRAAACRIASGLLERGLASGDRVAIMLSTDTKYRPSAGNSSSISHRRHRSDSVTPPQSKTLACPVTS